MSTPGISFIIPAYNCSRTIRDSIKSILNGNFELSDEIFIVDDCSTDGTDQKLKHLQADYPFLQIVRNSRNLGCPASRNIGIERSKNPIVFNLDSDNLLVPRTIRRLEEYLIKCRTDIPAFGGIRFFLDGSGVATHEWVFVEGPISLADYLSGLYNPGSSGNYMYTKESWLKVGGYDEWGAGLHESWGFTLKQLASGAKMLTMPGSFYLHRYGHESLFVRESKYSGASSQMASKMLMPFFHLIDEEDVTYVTGEEGNTCWFDRLNHRPIRLKTRELGRNGRRFEFHPPIPYAGNAVARRLKRMLSFIKRLIRGHS